MNKSTAIMKKIKPYLVKYWVAMMWSFLFMRLTVGIFWSYENRFFFHWQRTDAVAVFLAIAIMAFLVFAGYHMFACFGKVGRYFARVAFVCLTLFYLKVNIFETIEAYDCPLYVNITSKILLLALVLVSLRYIERARRVCRAVLLIVSPILVIYASVLFAARPVKASYQAELGENISSVVSARPVDKICFIVMDEWSYDRLFDAGRVREEYPNVECLASQSFVFHQAYSPAGMTLDSLPSLIMGIKGNLAVREDGLLFRSDNSVKLPDEYDHIFKKMKMLGYFTELTGNYFPYAEVVGTGIDSGYSANIYKLFGDKICVNAMLFILDNFRIRLSFLSPVRRVYNMAKNCYFDSITFVIQKRCLAMISGGRKMFGMFHYTVPHPPMSFNPWNRGF